MEGSCSPFRNSQEGEDTSVGLDNSGRSRGSCLGPGSSRDKKASRQSSFWWGGWGERLARGKQFAPVWDKNKVEGGGGCGQSKRAK